MQIGESPTALPPTLSPPLLLQGIVKMVTVENIRDGWHGWELSSKRSSEISRARMLGEADEATHVPCLIDDRGGVTVCPQRCPGYCWDQRAPRVTQIYPLLLGSALLPTQRVGVLKGATRDRFRITTYF